MSFVRGGEGGDGRGVSLDGRDELGKAANLLLELSESGEDEIHLEDYRGRVKGLRRVKVVREGEEVDGRERGSSPCFAFPMKALRGRPTQKRPVLRNFCLFFPLEIPILGQTSKIPHAFYGFLGSPRAQNLYGNVKSEGASRLQSPSTTTLFPS